MVHVCEFEIFKYKSRLGKKSLIKGLIMQVIELYYINRQEQLEQFKQDHLNEVMSSDLEKIETWKNYKDMLVPLLHKGHKNMTVRFALEQEGIELEYKI